MMSTASKKSSGDVPMMCCASCGIAAIDDVKLKDCDGGCDLVRYCSNDCQNDHRDQHEDECKRRLAEIRDKDLFTMPDESCYGECPLCCLPLPLDPEKFTMMPCCSNIICIGCNYANKIREIEAGLERRCAFCREPSAKSDEEVDKRLMERIKKKCPVAMCERGKKHELEGDHKSALECYTKAAELGNATAHFNLSGLYRKGEGVEKDEKKNIYHLEKAAIAGLPEARHNLGIYEAQNDRYDRAKKHFIIAANLGYHTSLYALRLLYADGHASKEDYADALRAYQAAVDATKSSGRERAERIRKHEE